MISVLEMSWKIFIQFFNSFRLTKYIIGWYLLIFQVFLPQQHILQNFQEVKEVMVGSGILAQPYSG